MLYVPWQVPLQIGAALTAKSILPSPLKSPSTAAPLG